MNDWLFLYILAIWAGIILIILIFRMIKVKVWIKTRLKKNGRLLEIGYLKYEGEAVSEVFVSGGNSKMPIGRVKKGESRDNNGYADMLSSSYSESTGKPSYRMCGYVTPEGYIYKKVGRNGKPERIGYTARPSNPDVPTSVGERSWKTLWLVSTLNAYVGKPAAKLPDADDALETKQTTPKPIGLKSLVFNGLDDDNTGAEHGAIEPETAPAPESEPANMEPAPESTPAEVEPVPEPMLSDALVPEEAPAPEEPVTEEPLASEADEAVVEETASPVPENGEEPQPEEPEKGEANTDNAPEEEPQPEEPQPEEAEKGEAEAENASEDKEESAKGAAGEPDEEDQEGKGKKGKKNKRKQRKQVREPDAVCHFCGFHNSNRDILTPESRACAFAILFERYNKNNYEEYYKSKPYGWLDTALLTSLVYSVIYLILYAVFTYVLKRTFIGDDIFRMYECMGSYFILWAFVRQLKIFSIESSNSIQTRLDLFNKSLGLKFFDISIVILGLFTLLFVDDFFYRNYDFWPLVMAIVVGVVLNWLARSTGERWIIRKTLSDDETNSEDEEEPKNPEGDISRSYDWDLDSRVSDAKLHGNVTLYFTAANITDLRQINPFYAQLKEKSDKDYILEMFHEMKEHHSMLARLRYVTAYIKHLCEQHSLHELDKIQFVLDFVQEPNIKFCMNRDSSAVNRLENYIRYPDETLYDKEGDSNSKALLAAMLFHLLKYNVLYMHSQKQQHAAIGVEVKPEWVSRLGSPQTVEEITLDYNGRKYVFCETTGDKFRIVDVMNGMRYEDFEERIELPMVEENVDDTNEDETMETRIYNWDLDSEKGNKLHGSITLEFNKNDILELREMNPFRLYGKDGRTYEQNMRSMFGFIFADEERMTNVNSIVKYMRDMANDAKLSSLDLAQFALDFVQAPNVVYHIDEESAPINYIKEYMRFPDEVLFDKEGDCDCKSSLATALFHALGYNVIFLLSEKLQHMAIAIEWRDEWEDEIPMDSPESVIREYNGTKYVYCETTGDGFRIGHIKEDYSILDFETVVEVPA